jgi:sterol-4alpha-carboxylate 3-dehydrogenase (decarboxylating)
MLEAAKDNNTPNFLFTSSCTVLTDDLDHDYPNFTEDLPFPKTSLMYGESKVPNQCEGGFEVRADNEKALAEQIVMAANSESLSCCALRPSVILGREDYQLIPSIHSCIASGETKYQIGDADNLYDFTFIGEH